MTAETSVVDPGKFLIAVAAATASACATSLLAGFVFALAVTRSIQELFQGDFYAGGLFVGMGAAMVALVVCPLLFVVVGLPLYVLSVRQGWVTIGAYTAVGAAISCLAAAGAYVAFDQSPERYIAPPLTFVGGTLATIAFWLAARR